MKVSRNTELRAGLLLNPCTAQIPTQVMAPSPLRAFYEEFMVQAPKFKIFRNTDTGLNSDSTNIVTLQ